MSLHLFSCQPDGWWAACQAPWLLVFIESLTSCLMGCQTAGNPGLQELLSFLASCGLPALRQLLCLELRAQVSCVREIQATPFASQLPCRVFYRNWTPRFVDIKDLRAIYVNPFRISNMSVGGPNNLWRVSSLSKAASVKSHWMSWFCMYPASTAVTYGFSKPGLDSSTS